MSFLGRVCALYYDGGGMILYQREDGRTSYARFYSGQLDTSITWRDLTVYKAVQFELSTDDDPRPIFIKDCTVLMSALQAYEPRHREPTESNKHSVLAREFHYYCSRFLDMSLALREQFVEELARNFGTAKAAEDWDELCKLLQIAAAVLSNPRQKPSRTTICEIGMSEQDMRRLHLAATLQNKLRRLLYQGLELLNLTDAGTESLLIPLLNRLTCLIHGFEQSTGQHVENAMAGQQWARLRLVLQQSGQLEPGSARGDLLVDATLDTTRDLCESSLLTPGRTRLKRARIDSA
eukprot:TRINITY_DN105403_c0_g1_i1.p1 TRINITY_DN105403_c0_g1~~TRINITY_DN105403_c0_g1_i1.p1  ORF type:complete len:293 (-),score=40.62 TRINITY_DN105403_c0_g1_i1:229-1107(-)